MDARLESIKSLNYWDGKRFDNGLERRLYLGRIMPFVGNRLIKVLVGQRRAGKSYVMRQAIDALLTNGMAKPHQILYVNREFFRYRFLETADDLMSLFDAYVAEVNSNSKTWLFLDEAQSISEWEKAVNSLSQDPSVDCEVFVTGSNSRMLSGDLATLLSGRYVKFEIQPFSYEEHLSVAGKEAESRQSMVEYLQTGGLPEFANLTSQETRRHYVEALKDTILLRDIVERYKIKDAPLLDRIMAYLLNSSSSLVSVGNIVNYLNNERSRKSGAAKRENYETVTSYIGHLENSFLIHRAERYDIKGKDILRGAAKFYANDCSYHSFLYGGYGFGQGALLESYVYQALRRFGYKVYVGKAGETEVDFIGHKADTVLYVQATWTLENADTREREYRALEAIRDSFPKIVVSMDDIAARLRNGIAHVRAWELERRLAAATS